METLWDSINSQAFLLDLSLLKSCIATRTISQLLMLTLKSIPRKHHHGGSTERCLEDWLTSQSALFFLNNPWEWKHHVGQKYIAATDTKKGSESHNYMRLFYMCGSSTLPYCGDLYIKSDLIFHIWLMRLSSLNLNVVLKEVFGWVKKCIYLQSR